MATHSIRHSLFACAFAALLMLPSVALTAKGAATPCGRSGRIVETTSTTVVFCVAANASVSVGGELEVFRSRRVNDGPKGMGRMEREVVAKVRVTGLSDTGHVTAAIDSGSATTRDRVRLQD